MTHPKQTLDQIQGKALSVQQRIDAALKLAEWIWMEAERLQTSAEKSSQKQIAGLMSDPKGKAFVASMTDQCFRSKDPQRVADQISFLLSQFGTPSFLPFSKQILFEAFRWFGRPLANLGVPFLKHMLRKETLPLIIPGESASLSEHLRLRSREGVRINLNRLGEAILGEEEAKKRLNIYLSDLANPSIECISVKISSICSQLNLLDWEGSLSTLSQRLKQLFSAAKKHSFTRMDGSKEAKFVNLDMEEYRDLRLTVDLFRKTLDEEEFHDYSAGIALQSYLPDSFSIQQELTAWAMKRTEKGGKPIKIRIVKGANLAMERVESSLRGWTLAAYPSKHEVDANFKKMVDYGCAPDHAKAVFLGIGSHNLFDIAYAMLLRSEKNVEKYVSFEMLEGMASPICRVIQSLAGSMLLYCPAATQEEFQNAVAYLIRRLDENTSPENFLRHSFNMQPGSQEWRSQSSLFSQACHAVDLLNWAPRRNQNRWKSIERKAIEAPFENEPDTDWALPKNRLWGESILREWPCKPYEQIPLVIGQEIFIDDQASEGEDPSCPGKKFYKYTLAKSTQIDAALNLAVAAFHQFSKKSLSERLLLLDEIAHQMRQERFNLIGSMVADTGKTVYEADIEVSEAIDFAEYYRRNAADVHLLQDILWMPKGPVLVAPPWNFPCSIAAGGILAALAAGNSVIFKPAPEAVLVGWEIAKIFWRSGVDRETLQFITCQDEPFGSQIVQDPRLAVVLLTGGTSTALHFKRLRPGLDLIAETGGKNAMIVTRMADRDLATKDIIQSAFGYAGQKCSACSLVILEKEVYEDHTFIERLRDAAASLPVGSAWNPSTRVNPLIRPPNPNLRRGLTELEDGEAWILQPKQDALNPNLWSPGIKIGVKNGSFTHQTELFGPVLGIMEADNLSHAIALANATPYGLTSGIHTLDEREQDYWTQHIVAGNCAINRSITGAVVQRQPFGGTKNSSFGPGAKAGGPNYVMQLMHAKQEGVPYHQAPLNEAVAYLHQQLRQAFKEQNLELWEASASSYAYFWEYYFSKKHDPSLLLGQDNLFFYKPETCLVRIQKNDLGIDLFRCMAAALTCGASIRISLDSLSQDPLLKIILENCCNKFSKKLRWLSESDEKFIQYISAEEIGRLRLLSVPNPIVLEAIANQACRALIAPVLANGRIELLKFLREISLSCDYHRYGNLGMREGEQRRPSCQQVCQQNCQQACSPNNCCRV